MASKPSLNVLKQTASKSSPARLSDDKAEDEEEIFNNLLKKCIIGKDSENSSHSHPSFQIIPKFHKKEKKQIKKNLELNALVWFESMYTYIESEMSLLLETKCSISRTKIVNKNNQSDPPPQQYEESLKTYLKSEESWCNLRSKAFLKLQSMLLDLSKSVTHSSESSYKQFHTSIPQDHSRRINYDDLQELKECIVPYLQRIITAQVLKSK